MAELYTDIEDTELIPIPTDTNTPAVPNTNVTCNMEADIEDIDTNVCAGATSDSYTVGSYFGTLIEATNIIWKYHLSTNTHWLHQELDYLYHAMRDKVDFLIEQYQGIIEGIIPSCDYANKLTMVLGITWYIRDLRTFLIDGRLHLFSQTDSAIWSTIDDLIALLDRIIYKLTAFNEQQPVQTFEAFCYENFDCMDDDYSEDEEE